MVINNLNVFRAIVGPAKANPELVIDADAVLAPPVSL
jgi:hypothetical protein